MAEPFKTDGLEEDSFPFDYRDLSLSWLTETENVFMEPKDYAFRR